MRKLLLLVLLTGTAFSICAQNRIVFTYDDVGNRTSREIQTVILPGDSTAVSDTTNVATDLLANYVIKVYPNPTYGQLSVEIEDFEMDKPLTVIVSDRSGIILQQYIMNQPAINIDMSRYPQAAWYIVTFVLEGERRDFKIIKL